MKDAGSISQSAIKVIGVGNAYRGDDGVGLFVARQLRDSGLDGVTILEQGGEGTALIELWKDADLVILIDAVNSGAKPGTVHRFDAHEQPIPVRFFRHSTHTFGVADAVELARTLGQLPLRLIIYGIEGKDFTSGEGLSADVRDAVSAAVVRIVREIQ